MPKKSVSPIERLLRDEQEVVVAFRALLADALGLDPSQPEALDLTGLLRKVRADHYDAEQLRAARRRLRALHDHECPHHPDSPDEGPCDCGGQAMLFAGLAPKSKARRPV